MDAVNYEKLGLEGIDDCLNELYENELKHLDEEFEDYEQLYPHRKTSHSDSPLLYGQPSFLVE